ncbi:hypothetical protein CCR75_002419 [Bremia lactucae]|uniref:Uncharacterized protein n=1 Tax=Bremia lactucae TaxID=4779 RepID=A0A976FIW2_BRELC|nr:hypothetical protein CCR75_002419 [Bremia lactucae]
MSVLYADATGESIAIYQKEQDTFGPQGVLGALKNESGSGRSTAATSVSVPAVARDKAPGLNLSFTKRNNVVRRIVMQTIGNLCKEATLHAVHRLQCSIENYCASTKSLTSLGKALDTSLSLIIVVDERDSLN